MSHIKVLSRAIDIKIRTLNFHTSKEMAWRKLFIKSLECNLCLSVCTVQLVSMSKLMKVYPWNLLTILIEFPVIFDALHFVKKLSHLISIPLHE